VLIWIGCCGRDTVSSCVTNKSNHSDFVVGRKIKKMSEERIMWVKNEQMKEPLEIEIASDKSVSKLKVKFAEMTKEKYGIAAEMVAFHGGKAIAANLLIRDLSESAVSFDSPVVMKVPTNFNWENLKGLFQFTPSSYLGSDSQSSFLDHCKSLFSMDKSTKPEKIMPNGNKPNCYSDGQKSLTSSTIPCQESRKDSFSQQKYIPAASSSSNFFAPAEVKFTQNYIRKRR
jgi:hypothetical protein